MNQNKEIAWVYCWVNQTNGKRRCGHTENFDRRIKDHKKTSKISNHHFYNALKKYPIEEGHWIIESLKVFKDEMLWLEKMWKVLYKTTDPKYGYDLMIDEEDRSGKNNHMFGKKRPEHSKRMCGENNPMFGKIGKDHPSFGTHLSAETIKKQSEAKMGEKNHRFGKGYLLMGENNPNFGNRRSVEWKINQSKKIKKALENKKRIKKIK